MLRQANAVGFVRRENGYLLTEMFSPISCTLSSCLGQCVQQLGSQTERDK